jgi:hypothetical protein
MHLSGDKHNLPPLRNVHDINHIQPAHLVHYLKGYGVHALPAAESAEATDRLRKNVLKEKVGCTVEN